MEHERSAPIGLAVIGLGVIGRRMLEQVARRGDFVITGAWDIDPGAVERAARDFPQVRTAPSAEAAIAAPGTQLVYVGTPPGVHLHYALLAAQHRRLLFCEKPLAADVAEGERLVQALQSASIRSAVNFVYASAPAADALARRLASGAIGRPVAVEVQLHFARWPRDWQASARWLAERAEGGFTREVLSHFVYLAQRLFGDCRLLDALVDYPDDGRGCERASLARLDCNGVPMTVRAGSGGAGPDEVRFTVRGERVALRLENWYELHASDGERWQPVAVPPGVHPDARTAAYQAQLDSLARFVAGQGHPLPDAAAALRVQRAIESLLRSSRGGTPG